MHNLDIDTLTSQFFGNNAKLSQQYHDFLLHQGLERGLLGPREGDKLWSRHIFNSALTAEAIRDNSSILDIGTGAGLPGIPIFLRRPHSTVHLVDRLARRIDFLNEFITDHHLESHLHTYHGKIEAFASEPSLSQLDYIVCRAVSNIGNLCTIAKPFMTSHTQLIALKGKSVHKELEANQSIIKKLGLTAEVNNYCVDFYDESITVVKITLRT